MLQTFHRSLRSCVLRWVALHPVSIKVLQHDCVAMLQTRLVLLIESFVIRLGSNTKLPWMMDSVFSRFRARPARSSGSLRELANFTIQIFRTMCKYIVPASLMDPFAIKRRSVDPSSELTLISSSVFLLAHRQGSLKEPSLKN